MWFFFILVYSSVVYKLGIESIENHVYQIQGIYTNYYSKEGINLGRKLLSLIDYYT